MTILLSVINIIKIVFRSFYKLIYFSIAYYKQIAIMKKYICNVCGWIYDPAVGIPEDGIAPGTAFEDLPEDWVCPICGVGKDMFEEA